MLARGSSVLRTELDFTQAFALVDVLTFQGDAFDRLGQNQFQGDGIFEIMFPVNLYGQKGSLPGLQFQGRQLLEGKGRFLDPQDERQIKMSQV